MSDEKRYIVLDEFYDASSGRVHNLPPDLCPGESRALLVPCDEDGNVTPEGARALHPELADAVDAWTEHVTDSEHLNVGRVAMTAARLFTIPDQPDQEHPELDEGGQP